MRKKYIIFIFTVFAFLIGLAGLTIFSKSSNIDRGIEFTGNHTVVGPLLLVVWRVAGTIFPFFPAGIVSFAVVPIFGWLNTYIYTLIGIVIGTSIAFFLARIFREHLVERFIPLKKIHKLQDEISKKKEFMAIVVLRLFTVPVMDFSSYIAGLTKISYRKFLLATILASIPDIFIFYIGEEVYRKVFGKSVFVAVIGLLVIGFSYYIFKKNGLGKKKAL